MRAKIWPRGPSQEQVPQRVPVAEVNEGNLSSARRGLIRLVKADRLDLLKMVTGIAWQAPYYCEASSGTGTRGTYCVCAACLPPLSCPDRLPGGVCRDANGRALFGKPACFQGRAYLPQGSAGWWGLR